MNRIAVTPLWGGAWIAECLCGWRYLGMDSRPIFDHDLEHLTVTVEP